MAVEHLYGYHTILGALRVFAFGSSGQQPQSQGCSTSTHATAFPTLRGVSEAEEQAAAGGSHSSGTALPPLHHPHRSPAGLCLYVRDFSVEEHQQPTAADGQRARNNRKRIPPQYTQVHRLLTIAKSLGDLAAAAAVGTRAPPHVGSAITAVSTVPIRFVPRKELVKLCHGDRHHQNVVLAVSPFRPHSLSSLTDIIPYLRLENHGHPSSPAAAATAATTTILYLHHLMDPVNVGGILRSCYFHCVDHVILGPGCCSCTPAVARSSVGMLEYLSVYQVRSPGSSRGSGGGGVEERMGALTADFLRSGKVGNETDDGASARRVQFQIFGSAAQPPSPAAPVEGSPICSTSAPSLPLVRVLVIGSERDGLPPEVLAACDAVLHLSSPRSSRCTTTSSNSGSLQSSDTEELRSVRSEGALHSSTCADAAPDGHVDAEKKVGGDGGVLERAQRAARMRPSEVSLNAHVACSILLSKLTDGSMHSPPSVV